MKSEVGFMILVLANNLQLIFKVKSKSTLVVISDPKSRMRLKATFY